MTIFDILKSISETKEDLSVYPEFNKAYEPFMINRYLSMLPDTASFAEQINTHGNLSKKLQYYFYLYSIPRKYRYFKYEKKDKVSEAISIIGKYYNVNEYVAREYYEVLSSDAINDIAKLIKNLGDK